VAFTTVRHKSSTQAAQLLPRRANCASRRSGIRCLAVEYPYHQGISHAKALRSICCCNAAIMCGISSRSGRDHRFDGRRSCTAAIDDATTPLASAHAVNFARRPAFEWQQGDGDGETALQHFRAPGLAAREDQATRGLSMESSLIVWRCTGTA